MNKEQIKQYAKSKFYRDDGNPNPNLSRLSYCEKRGGEILDFHNSVFELTSLIDHLDPKFSNRVYCILNDVDSIPTCKMCDNPVTLFWKPSRTQMFNTYCCVKCSRSDPENDVKRRKTNLKIHGIENPIHKVKTKRTLTFDIMVERAKKHYGDRFEYTDISFDENYKYSVYCKKHEYIFSPNYKDLVLGKTNCRYCRSDALTKNQLFSREKVNEMIYQVKGDSIILKGKYNGMQYRTLFECKEHGEFYKRPCQILQNQNCPLCYVGRSREEQELYEYIVSISPQDKKVIPNNRDILDGNDEIDISVGDVMIEYDGIYWHSDVFHDSDFHIDKTLKANRSGYKLFHVWSNEWTNEHRREIWKSIFSGLLNINETKIYANECELVAISNDDYKSFLSKNHLQGFSSASIRYGLIYENEIVSIMSFSKPKIDHKYDYELVRYCSKNFIDVIDAEHRLFSHFYKYHLKQNQSVVSYSDKRICDGEVYKNLGFYHYKTTIPNSLYTKNWKNLIGGIYFSEKDMKKILGDNYDPTLSESENMKNNGYYRIYDCGNDVWEFTNSNLPYHK